MDVLNNTIFSVYFIRDQETLFCRLQLLGNPESPVTTSPVEPMMMMVVVTPSVVLIPS